MESRGQINRYVPYRQKSDHGWFTINLANGTTPFMKRFKDVECNSECYRFGTPAIRINVRHAWYRPTRADFDALDQCSQDHVLNGGLLFATLAEAVAKQLPADPVEIDWSYEQFQAWCLEVYGKRRGPMDVPPTKR